MYKETKTLFIKCQTKLVVRLFLFCIAQQKMQNDNVLNDYMSNEIVCNNIFASIVLFVFEGF